VAAEAQTDRSEQELAERQTDADQRRDRWAAASAAWREDWRAWPPDGDALGIDWTALHAVLLEGPAEADELARTTEVALATLGPHREGSRSRASRRSIRLRSR
jgi:hypothetical protein